MTETIRIWWEGYFFSNTVNNAVNYAFNRGALVVATAGNAGISRRIIPLPTKKLLG